MQIAGLASNRGRNLMHIAERAPGGAELAVVLTNDADAPVLETAATRAIPTEVVERPPGEPREEHEERILEALSEYEIDLVCLDGYMRILTERFLDSAPTTLNVHPSLLPAFPGMDAHEKVLEAGVSITGCTVHVATETVDAGPIVTQEPIPVFADDDRSDLKRRVLYEGEFKAYPRAIRWFADEECDVEIDWERNSVHVDADDSAAVDGDGAATAAGTTGLAARWVESEDRRDALRYGENPHQDAAVYGDESVAEASIVDADQLNPEARALSYNNYNDADGALGLIKEFDEPAAAVIKHTNPAGCATADTLSDAYAEALSTDPMSAFGGIVALNRTCDGDTAEQVIDSFKEVVVAPGYTDEALSVLRETESLRVLDVGDLDADRERYREKPLTGGRLVQERDDWVPTDEDLEVVTEREPTAEQVETMTFAWRVLKHVKSNAIVYAQGTETVGVGAGQMSRVDAVRLAGMKAEEHAEGKSADGAVMASDAFFPFPDGVEEAADAGIEAVIQPGGSKNDDKVIEAADELGLAMVFTGHRCFRHD